MVSFLNSCGATGPISWTVELRNSTITEALTFDQPFLVIGRSPGCDLRWSHPEVSDRHAYLQWFDGRVYFADLGSRTGTYLDGRCRRSGWVNHGGTIRIGPYRLRLSGDTDRLERSGCSRAHLGLTLDLGHRSIRSTSLTTTDPVSLVGSSSLCQVRLLDPSVSQVHCALIHTTEGIWVVDLNGRGDLTVNGCETRLSLIAAGDKIELGQSVVRLSSPGLNRASSERPRRFASTDPDLLSSLDLRPVLSSLSPDQAEIAESLLLPLVHQFGIMQQQMFDRLQKVERERFKTLTTMQGEQFSVLREELEAIRELRQDVDELRSELRTEGRASSGDPQIAKESNTRRRLGSASSSMVPDMIEALPGPELHNLLRLNIGEAS